MSDQNCTDSVGQSPPQSVLDALSKIPKPPGSHELWTFQSKGTTPLPECLGAFTVLRERHDVGCTCSYCRTFASSGRFGLKWPKSDGNHSWRVLWWRWRNELQVVRWTRPTQARRDA